jgi:transcriptional regulator NrdR family protein
MIKCPYCCEKAEHFHIETKTIILPDEVVVSREYTCAECGETFYTRDYYNKAGYTIIDKEREE